MVYEIQGVRRATFKGNLSAEFAVMYINNSMISSFTYLLSKGFKPPNVTRDSAGYDPNGYKDL